MNQTFNQPAAFRRLCVETLKTVSDGLKHWPAAFRRLCVETPCRPNRSRAGLGTAAFRRLCVETLIMLRNEAELIPAAFRRLCVETKKYGLLHLPRQQPPSGGCVLKRCRI